ncbi:hypothetical protein [Altericroceibacterium indicum]|uniref:hypothetical protein n=1 Tax=Altericroceibacterium indicum TaxID=374177 RepID=UPI001B8713E0|nr:hypothetical protein [Altericroceibacterium indicum]
MNSGSRFLLLQSIQDYLAIKADGDEAIGYRLAHVTEYIAERGDLTISCERITEEWVKGFREWLAKRPIVSKYGKERERALSTIENSVIQLAAAINFSHSRGDTARPTLFKPVPTKSINRTPHHRSDVKELASMFRFAADPRFPKKRGALHRFLIAAVATMARPDAVHDIHLGKTKRQWNSDARILDLNPAGRRQTKKYRPILPIAWQAALHFDAAEDGYYVGVQSVRSAWDTMAIEIGLPGEGQGGMKLVRRSMAKLLRDRMAKSDWQEIEMFLGHSRFDQISDIYAPFDPGYLSAARTEIEAIIDEIEKLAPGAFRRSSTGDDAEIIPIGGAKKYA